MKNHKVAWMLVVVGLAGTLITVIGSAAAFCILDDSPIARARADIRAIEAALEFHRLENFRHPSTRKGRDGRVGSVGLDGTVGNWDLQW